jgi:hypothetical protein
MNYTRTHTGLVRTRAGVVIGGGYEPPDYTTEPAVFVPEKKSAGFDVTAAGRRWAVIVALACAATLVAMHLVGWLL